MAYNRKTISIVTPPAQAIVSLADMKSYLRVDTTHDDTLINGFIASATQNIREYLRRSLITETLELSCDGFTEGDGDYRMLSLGAGTHTGARAHFSGSPNRIDLPYPPVQSITSVKSFDRANIESTFSDANYQVDERGGRLYLNQGVTWPQNLRSTEAVKITYVTGYGSSSADIPATIIQAVQMNVAQMYDCREACGLSAACMKLLAPYRILDDLGFC